MNDLEKIVVVLPNSEKELIREVKELDCEVQETRSNYFDADLNTVTLLVTLTQTVVTALATIIVAAISKAKKTATFKYKGLELSGYSKKEILEILNMLAAQNEQILALKFVTNEEDANNETKPNGVENSD